MRLKRVPVAGGPAITLGEHIIRGMSWGSDDQIVSAHSLKV